MGIRILVVDDATFVRDMIKKQLRDKIPGVEIMDAIDGARALAAIKQQLPDIVLSDWEMPNMTGAELLTKVRSMPEAGKIPFVMISSRGDRNHIVKAIELGVSDYLTKPFTAEELLKKVYKQLKIIGKSPDFSSRGASTQGVAFASVDVLTGGRTEIAPAAPKTAINQSASMLMGTAPKVAPVKAPVTVKGKAQLRFANNLTFACSIREISLQLVSCAMPRSDQLPGLFDQAVVDIETGDGNNLARVNGYVHALQAAEGRPDTDSVKIVIRFVDNDAEKFEVLSKYIAQM